MVLMFAIDNPAMRKPTCYLETLTGHGRAAIAVVRLSGNSCEMLLERCFVPASVLPYRIGQIRYGHWDGPDGESVVVTPVASPIEAESLIEAESTKSMPMAFEIHCHGGNAATAAIAHSLQVAASSLGLSLEPAPLKHGDAAIASRVAANCVTEKTTAYALAQARGAFRDWMDEAHAVASKRGGPLDPTTAVQGFRACDVLRWSKRIGLRLAQPREVCLWGVPNVGKSTLINAILGHERAITMDMPGTTRDVVRGETAIEGWPIVIADTAGIRSTTDAIELEGVRRAAVAADAADLVLWVGGPEGIPDQPRHDRIVKVWNQSDRSSPPTDDWITTVATTGDGLDTLMRSIVAALVGDLPPVPSQPPLALDGSQLKRLEAVIRSNRDRVDTGVEKRS